MDLDGSAGPWNELGDGPDHTETDDMRAFAAYHAAWTRRRESGDDSDRLLRDALRERDVDPATYAEGTLLHETLWASWAADRGPRRMQLTVARFRARRVLRAPRAFVDLFRDPLPAALRVPVDVRPLLGGEEVDLPFTPSPTLWPLLAQAWPDLDVHTDDLEPGEDPWVELPVWLEVGPDPARTPVVLGRQRVGETVLPASVHGPAHGRTDRRGRRVAPRGSLLVERGADGRFAVGSVDAVAVPDPGD